MGSSNPQDLGNGGEISGDLTVTGSLNVGGSIGLTLSEVIQGTSTIDVNSTTALVVRKDGAAGDVMVVDTANSRVGIGITPTVTAHISGTGELLRLEGANAQLRVDNSTTDTINLNVAGGSDSMKLSTGSTTALTIDSNQNVSIGNSSPEAPLDVLGTAGDYLDILLGDNRTNSSAKRFGIAVKHYTNAEEPFGFLSGFSNATLNELYIGGNAASSITNDATNIKFFTASNNTTVSGSLAMTIDSNQKIGIGTSSPSGKLTLSNGSASAPLSITASNSYIQLGSEDFGSGGLGKFMIGFGYTDVLTNTNAPAYIGFEETSTSGDTKGDLTFYTRNVTTDTLPTKRLTIGADGVSTFSGEVKSTSNITSNSGGVGKVSLATSGNNAVIDLNNDSPTHTVRIHAGGDTFFNGGNVGIGISSSIDKKLHIASSTSADGITIENTSTGATQIRFEADSSAFRGLIGVDDSDGGAFLSSTASKAYVMCLRSESEMHLGTNGNNTAMVIDTSQNVSIGSATDSAKYLKFVRGGSGTGAVRGSIGTNNSKLTFIGGSGTSSHMTLDSSGNLGIGDTSPSGLTNAKVLDIKNTSTGGGTHAQLVLEGSNGHNFLSLFSGDDTTGGDPLILYDSGHVLRFGLADDVSATNFSEKMRLDSSGNLGIGSDNPIAGGGSKTVLTISDSTQSLLVFEDTGFESSGDGLGMFAYNDGTLTYRTASRSGTDFTGSTNRLVIDTNSRISLSNNDSGGTGGSDSTSGNTLMGHLAGENIASGGVDNSFFGHGAGAGNTTGDFNTDLGNIAGLRNQTGSQNTYVGYASGLGASGNSHDTNTAVGYFTLKDVTTGGANTVIGCFAGDAVTSQDSLTLVGKNAGGAINDDGANGTTAVGTGCLGSLTSGADNVAIGMNAMFKVNTGHDNVALGKNAGFYATTAGFNTFIGKESAQGINATKLTGDNNVAVGYRAGYNMQGSSASNVIVGSLAGDAITTGTSNVIVGQNSDISAVDGTNQIVIGQGVAGQADNTVTLGNSSITDVYMAQDGEARIHCSQIQFPSSQISSSHANRLDDYEEGNFTVTIKSGDSGAISAEEGEYVKIGKVVHFRIAFTVGTNFSTEFIDGLPFTCTNAASPSGLIGSFGVLTSASNDEPIFASVVASETQIRFFSGSDATDTHLPNTTNNTYRLAGTYFAS